VFSEEEFLEILKSRGRKVKKFTEKTGRYDQQKNTKNFTREGFDEGSDLSEEDAGPDMEEVINQKML